MKRQKIAILGGGPAGLAAAWELSRHPDWREHYEITVYQTGWRLGGKCATGRGPGQRIEEHGIHVFLGSYDATFTLLKEVYGARADYGIASDSPFKTWEDAFHRIDCTILADTGTPDGPRWQAWPLTFPRNECKPGSGAPTPVGDVVRNMLGTAVEALLGSPYAVDLGRLRRWTLESFFADDDEPEDDEPDEGGWGTRALKGLYGIVTSFGRSDDESVPRAITILVDLLEFILGRLERIETDEDTPSLRGYLALAEFALVMFRGMIADTWDPKEGTWDFSRVDHLDLREWMRIHGASERCQRSSLVRFLYAGTFSNVCDGTGEGGQYAAGVALRAIFKMLSYKGSLVWQPRAGTGDTLIAPLFQVLEARGVRLEFFHRVEHIHDSDSGQIQRIDVSRQARVPGGPYRPLIPVKTAAGVVESWPDRPLWDQLDPRDVAAIQAIGHHSECAGVSGERRTLERGVDFDQVILATPVATLRHLCPEIVARVPSWRSTVSTVKTTATQSFQLWFEPDNHGLGVPLEAWGGVDDDGASVVTYANGFGAWTDATVTLPFEDYGPRQPGSASHFCGAFIADEDIDERDPVAMAIASAEVRARAQEWTTANMGWLFPDATTPEDPYGLDYTKLAMPPGCSAARPLDRWRAQYFRANVQPSERYTLTVPGSFEGRMGIEETGFDNLLVCGDWVAHAGLNSGFVDGAIFCGIQAGRAQRERVGQANPDPLPVDPDILEQLTASARRD